MLSNKINIGINEVYKISRTLNYIYESIHRYDDYAKSVNFDFLRCDDGEGSSDIKITKAFEYSADLIPDYFTEYYESYKRNYNK